MDELKAVVRFVSGTLVGLAVMGAFWAGVVFIVQSQM